MSVFFRVTMRPSEMSRYNDKYNVWNGNWGFSNFGNPSARVDAATSAIIMPLNGFYRVTGMISGQAAAAGLMVASINVTPDQLNGGDPTYPFPYNLGCNLVAASTKFSMGFSGTLEVGYTDRFSIYLSSNFSPEDPRCMINFEQMSY